MKKNLAMVLGTAIGLVLVLIFLNYYGDGIGIKSFNGTPHQAGVSTTAPVEASATPATQATLVQELNGSVRTTIHGDKIMGDDMVSAKSGDRIKMTFGNEEVFVRMNDNPTSRDFLTQLPLTLTLKDYEGTEKISYLPKKLSTKGAPVGSDPDVGDFAYYSPWGNLAIYYRDFGYSDGLVILGSVESGGAEKLARRSGDFTVTLERTD
jgi:hypothetical protein